MTTIKIENKPFRELPWKVHANEYFQKVIELKGGMSLRAPSHIFLELLEEIAKRSIELNDPILHSLMCRLAMYEISDYRADGFDQELTEEVIGKGFKMQQEL